MRAVMTIIASLLVASSVHASQGTIQWTTVGGWDVRLDPTMGNSCFLYASYEGGSFFRLGFNEGSEDVYLMISDDDWKSIQNGKKYDIEIEFDDEGAWTGTATGTDLDGLNVLAFWHVGEVEFIREFMERHTLKLRYNGEEILRLSLKNSYRAVQELGQCQTAADEYLNNRGDGDPFSDTESNDSDPFSF